MQFDRTQWTNATVAAAIGVFHREGAQAIRPMMPGEVETPPSPKAEGFCDGPICLQDANELGSRLSAEMNVQMPFELAKACDAKHLPAALAHKAIEKILTARLQEATSGVDSERHAAWFVARHMGAFQASLNMVFGTDVQVHFSEQGMPVLIRLVES
jgi:hypothetical protein